MIPIFKIDVSEVSEEFNLTGKDVSDLKEEILSGLINELYRNWTQQAREKLKSTRSEYIRSLRVFKDNKFKGGIELMGWLPNRVEEGLEPFDIKIGELKSNKSKIGKRGQTYITIPFRIGIPTSIGENFSNIMPPAVYQVARALKAKQQIKKFNLPSEFQIPKTRPMVKNQTRTFEAYTHKAPLFQGIQRGQGKHHGQYTSFRRISNASITGSDPESWIHTGIMAYKLADKALENTDVVLITDRTVDNFLQQVFG